MAKIREMLGEKVISGFKGKLDFYYYLGQPVVRKWPRSPGRKRTLAVQSGWTPFTNAVRLWNILPPQVRQPFRSMSSGTALSDRDLFMRAYMSGIPKLYDLPIATIPHPAEGYWAILDWHKFLLDDGFIIVTTTDVPCHLWLCWTNVPPQRHIDPVLRRGLYMHGDPRYCFVAFNCVEQDEAGDTLSHSWYLRDWPEGGYRWFTFHGEIAGVASPSTYAIDCLRFSPIVAQSDPYDLWHVPVNKDFVQYAVFRPSTSFTLDHMSLKFGRHGEPGNVTISVHRMKPDGYPAPEALASDTHAITDIPPLPYGGFFTYQLPAARLAVGAWYALKAVCSAVPPVEARWYGYPNETLPDTYLMFHRLYDDRWFTLYNAHLQYLIRGSHIH